MWTRHFVSFRSTRDGAPLLVPILFKEYIARPTAWPQGQTGKRYLQINLKFLGIQPKIFKQKQETLIVYCLIF